MVIEVPLTRGHVALIDDEDAEQVLTVGRWCALVRRHTIYAMRRSTRPDGGQTTIRLHNFLTGERYVDHIDGDGLNNRRSNLRAADNQQNHRNRRKQTGMTSPYKGVHWSEHRQVWVAQIKVDRRGRHLGHFPTSELAAAAYDAAALDLFGEFARLNFPGATDA